MSSRPFLLVLAIVLMVPVGLSQPPSTLPPDSGELPGPDSGVTFSFAASGDHSDGSEFDASLDALAGAGTIFYVALGDFSYGPLGEEQLWCDRVTAKMGAGYPFQLLSGDHEDDVNLDGWIGNFIKCLPDRSSSNGTYGVEYYFDYPPASPLARVILVSPGITALGVTRTYSVGDPNYTWVSDTIDDARNLGIPWVVVGTHKTCITAGVKSCSVGQDLFDLLLTKRVDLILHANDHNYQRSKQLVCGPRYTFDSSCVVDDGADAVYAKGAGAVVVIQGIFGACCYAVDPAEEEAGYFAAMDDTSSGFVKYTVSVDRIDAALVNIGSSYMDSFSIVQGAGASPDVPQNVTATVSGDDVMVNWGLGSEVDVDHYEVFRGASYLPRATGYAKASPDLPLGTQTWVDSGVASLTGRWFYHVRAVGPGGQVSGARGQAAVFNEPVLAGPVLLSTTLIRDSVLIEDHFAGTLAWSLARSYDGSDAGDSWKRYDATKPGNDLTQVDRTLGIWILVTAAGDYRVAGVVPCRTVLLLRTGWNLVGFPSMTERTVATATAGLQGPIRVEGFSGLADPYRLQALAPSDLLRPPFGYWIQSPVDQPWVVVNDNDPDCFGAGGLRAAIAKAYQIGVPAYFYPPGEWYRMLGKGAALGPVVLNPNSGPGTSVDPNYVQVVADAQAAGVRLYGYVYTLYGTRDLNVVKGEVDAYDTFYGVTDIFFDEVPSGAGYESYYADLSAHVRSRSGQVILNPGTVIDESYMAYADIVVLYEDTWDNYAGFSVPPWVHTYPATRFWHIIHTAPFGLLDAAIAAAVSKNTGYLFITDDVEPNPYDTLATYWESL